MRFVSPAERAKLNSERDSKSRVRTSIELAVDHLTHAEEFTEQKQYEHALEEIGGYLGLIDDAMAFICTQVRGKGSTRDLYRHLDIALRAHIPRLAVMRRTTPSEFGVIIKAVEEYLRDKRSEALDSFYGHTVLRGDSNDKPGDQAKAPEEKKCP